MKNYFALVSFLLMLSCQQASSDQTKMNFVADDITHFFEAFDAIQATSDTAVQRAALQTMFLQKSSLGQQAMIEARQYSEDEYLNVIRSYPKFWISIRSSMEQHVEFSKKIDQGIQQFQERYPDYKPATTYFTVGAFRSPGTAVDSLVLIGAEFAFGNVNTITTEFPGNLSHVADYYKNFSTDDIALLSVHEYIHSQQNQIQYAPLPLFMYEGIAEFIATLVAGPSPLPAMKYAAENHDFVRREFEKDISNRRAREKWLWNNKKNLFGINDVGYYIGYAIAKGYYEKTQDKDLAIKTLIELDYEDMNAVKKIADASTFLSLPVDSLLARYEANRPKVLDIQEFKNGSQSVSPELKTITLSLSQKLDPNYRSTGFGELGKGHFPKTNNIIFSDDSLYITYEVELESNKRYQLLLESGYRTTEGVELIPYLVDFKTK